MKKNILITGASGWLGINLINAFLNGIDLYEETKNLSNEINLNVFLPKGEEIRLKKLFGDKLNYFTGDITNISDCRNFINNFDNFDLFHLAGIIHPKKISDLYSINYQGTKNILDNCNKSNCDKFIFISSNSPFGINKNQNEPFDENSKYKPYLSYGKSKKLAEEFVINYCKKKFINFIIVRPTWFYGPFQPKRQNLFFDMIINGKVPVVGNGSNLRSMTNTENLSYALILIWKNKKIKDDIFWIADEMPYSYISVINNVRNILEEKFKIKVKNRNLYLPNFLSLIAYIVDYFLQKLNLYNSKIHVLSELNKNIFCNIDKAKIILNYKPKINLENGLERNFNWMFNKNNNHYD
tara:strand:+ start:10267 stop:11325 length:1059 start_codon:yes stop_codon:yes gene_type:complete